MRWNRKELSRGSPVAKLILRPTSEMKAIPCEFIGPIDSHASGWKMWVRASSAYLQIFLLAAFSAALPGHSAVSVKYDGARVSATVTSQVRHLPDCHGMSVRPSGSLPSDLNKPDGSLMAGILAFVRARHTKSLIC